ncbi:precursor to secretory protein Ssp120 [Cristinia sonorae]|uniref:Precursor to secretory protein Ssp120 n=1 Tax=Cristinia sonorae TaxID=1940300 RepID=A0A8K0UN00_9AGAR|nr:precursor to secretory protein Ssp120 [Cristinia sonorae]
MNRIVMQGLITLLLLGGVQLARGHGGGHEGPAEGETIQQYAQRHMSTEHHIDDFDIGSFFQLHDLNRDGLWDREEIEAVYGVHHIYSQKKSKDDEEHQKKAKTIVDTVLKALDKDFDEKVSLEELQIVGLDGLPNFDDLGAEGHHYDIESEFFLHHEEQYHNTPETQTDESYNHPEDLEHFAHHEAIERKEAEREAIFQGITVEEALAQHEPHEHEEAPATPPPIEQQPGVDQQAAVNDGKPKFTRPPPADDPIRRFQEAKKAGVVREEWGSGDDGYKPPKTPTERFKKNLPYKDRFQYKFRRQWGDF